MASISLKYKSKSGNLTAPAEIDLGAMIPLATTTVGAGGVSTITFSSIPQVYEHLQLRGITRGGSEVGIYALFNGSGGSGHTLYGNGSLVGSFRETGIIPIGVTPNSSNTSTLFGVLVCDILDYANTNKFKTTRSLHGTEKDASGNSYAMFSSGLWESTSAISSIVIGLNGGANFAQNSQIALYGIKRAGA